MKILTGLFAVAMSVVPAVAGPAFISPFVGTTTIDFESFADGTLISTQLAPSAGISFNSSLGGIYSNAAYTGIMGSPMSATSFLGISCPCVDVTLSWASPITAVGFQLYTNAGTTVFTLPGGTLSTATGNPAYYYLGDTSGFNSLTITAPSNNAFAIDNITFSGGAAPEPSTFALFGLGAVALGAVRRRMTR